MKYSETCSCCDHTVTAYTHILNKSLVEALIQLVDFYNVKKCKCRLQNDLNLTKNQYNNFQKLQYFGLITDRFSDGRGSDQSGWLPTGRGILFVKGEHKVYNPVATMGSKILPLDHPAWETHKALPMIVGVNDILEDEEFEDTVEVTAYKTRDEYKEEKRGV